MSSASTAAGLAKTAWIGVFVAFYAVTAAAERPSAQHAYQLVNEQWIEEAAAELAPLVKAHPHDPEIAFVDGDIKLHLGEYAAAADRLDEAVGKLHGAIESDARELRDLARATAALTKDYAEERGQHFVVRYERGKDELLASYALAALEKAYAALGDDFGWRPTVPVRVEIYPAVADLAKVSPLTEKEIETSGTIALCKFNRLMIVSPRALITGYPWLDTLNHEYTHYVITRVSKNTVPIWLHEGLAKFEERRWRGPRDENRNGGMTPAMEHLLASGLVHHHLITFAQMHPSMAKLPSQADTALAFAEVYTAIEYLHEKLGWRGIREQIARLSDGKTPEILSADFESGWRTWLRGRKYRLHPGLLPAEAELRFKKGAGKSTEASEDDSGRIGEERARKLARLGGLLRARHRLAAAAIEYEKAQAIVGVGHPSVANKLARTYLELGDVTRAIATAEQALELYPDQAAPNATLGEAWLQRGDLGQAERYLQAALAVSPFDPAVHCGLERVYATRKELERAGAEGRICQSLR
jgi:tetratricopeptide (TPR) repeat protein